MKLSLNWIRDYIDMPADMDLGRMAYDLTMSTVEVEGAEHLADRFNNMVVGVITAIEQHPNADKLKVCKTDIGGEVKDIVCGGCNLSVGQRVAVALPGAFCRWHGEGEPVEIKKSKLRGVESYGMICASTEIGLGELFPPTQEAEILDLHDFDAPAGTPIAEALDLNDIILEIDNKSMTNRPDLWGHYGIARELAALYDLPLKPFVPFKTDAPAIEHVCAQIEDPDACPRILCAKVEGLSVKPSPFAMQTRLWRVGQRPINALVDITNYVMMATGQPCHAYDADNIKGHINVRHAKADEKLLLLNGKELALDPADLVISDSEGAVGLAGIMGGARDSILPGTESVLLEIANFNAKGIRRTALRYDNRTEASSRYEKAIDPERCDQAVSLAMELFTELYPACRVTGFADNYAKPLQTAEIDVSLNWLERRLGKRIANADIEKKMGAMGYTVTFGGDKMHVVAPTWRSTGDISIKADIMEEVARMVGYENFTAAPITTSFDGAINQLSVDLTRRIKEYLAIRCGMQEVFTYPWMDEQFVTAVLQDTNRILALATPPSPAEKYIRSSLLPNLCKAVVKNERYYTDFAIFENAQIFKDADYTAPYSETEKLPWQRKYIGGAFASDKKDVTPLFRKAKGVIENMARYTHMEALELKQAEKPVWADNVVWLNIFRGETQVGNLALLNKKASMACGIKNLNVMLFELDLDALEPFKSRTNRFTHLPEFPMVDYDISMLFDGEVKWDDIRRTVLSGHDALLHGAAFVDEYRGKQVPQGKKSVTIRLAIGSSEKTLTSEEIEACAGAALKRLGKRFGAELRSK